MAVGWRQEMENVAVVMSVQKRKTSFQRKQKWRLMYKPRRAVA
jgi:hypothetical protein